MAGLDTPGTVAPPDRTAALIPLVVGLVFAIGGIGGLVLVARRRSPLSMA